MDPAIRLDPLPAPLYYRATAKARLPGIVETVHDRSLYLHDVLCLCLRGAWDVELRQFMPPASLRGAVHSLLELGLIECVEDPPAGPVLEPCRAAPRWRAASAFA